MKTSLTFLSFPLTLALSLPAAFAQEPKKTGIATEGEETPLVHHPAGDKTAYSACAQRDFPTRVFFGDTHHHTANSGDAFMAGDRLSPEDAYRFAKG